MHGGGLARERASNSKPAVILHKEYNEFKCAVRLGGLQGVRAWGRDGGELLSRAAWA